MKKRRFERVTVMIVSIAMLLSSTGIISSLAANAGESSSAPSKASSGTVSSTTVTQEGGSVVTTNVTQEGGSLVVGEDGNGTAENPYKISDADDLLHMNDLINITTSSNKHFVLTSDIDLSGISEAEFVKRGSGLVSVNKNLAKSSENVYFTLDGNGHKITGLNVKANSASIISIFGYLNEKSEIKNLTVEKPQIISNGTALVYASVLAYENSGTIKNVSIKYPVMTLESCTYAGVVTAINNGTVTDVTVRGIHTNASVASAESHTLSACGTVGAVAGINKGTITAVSAINIGMYILSKADKNTVYGTVAGVNESTINNSVATGNVFGGKSSDTAGGLVGKVGTSAKSADNYVLVALDKNISGCAVIGAGGTADMIKDSFWSSSISKRNVPVTDACGGVNDISVNSFRVIRVGETAKVSASELSSVKLGNAVAVFNGELKVNGDGISLNSDATEVSIKGTTADSVGTISYVAEITLPSTIGAGSDAVVLKQHMKIYVLTVPKDAVGNGTSGAPLVVVNSAEFGFINYANTINIKLGKDIALNTPISCFAGTLDGDGHTVTAKGRVFTDVIGSVSNLNIVVTEDVSGSVFGNLYGAEMNNISVSYKDGVKLNAENGNVGIFADKIADASVINNCRVKGSAEVASDIYNVGGFAGTVCGKNTKLTNSGAAVDIYGKDDKKSASVANFIGSIGAEGVTIENCYSAGANTVGRYTFIGSISAKSVTLNNNYIEISENEAAAKTPLDFDSYKFASKNQFKEWTFDDSIGFFTGEGKEFTSSLPEIEAVKASTSDDFSLIYDASTVNASVKTEGGKLILSVRRASGVVTVKASPVKVVNNQTGLSTTIYVSNGLEKDSAGNYIITTAYDLAYIGENIEALADASFVMNTDVDMSVIKNYTPIGSSSVAFSGKFDGKGHTVSALTINGTAKTALFGTVTDAEIKNIKFVNANINSEGGYAAVLAGQATGKTVISGISVTNSRLTVNDNYAAIIVASADNANGMKISDVSVKNSAITSSAGYVGAVAGRITDNTSVTNAVVESFTASGSNYISGAVGLAQGESNVSLSDIAVKASSISGVSEVSGIASALGGTTMKNVTVAGSKIYTVSTDSAFAAGGISAVNGAMLENVSVENTQITAGIASGIVAKTAIGCNLVIKNATVKSTSITAKGANTVAAGILAVHNVSGSAEISGGIVEADVTVSGASITSGIVGDFYAVGGTLRIDGTKTFADVKDGEVNAVAAAGVVGRIGTSSVNSIAIDGVKVSGKISGSGVLGGVIGLIKGGEAYNGADTVIANTVAYPQITDVGLVSQTGILIGSMESDKTINSNDLEKFVNNTVISTYYGSADAFPSGSKLVGGGYVDMDKPNGSEITSSVPVLSTSSETEAEILNTPHVNGYTFDQQSGWASESDERIQVVASTENTVVLKANHKADISVVGYYVLVSDSDIRVPVHFRVVSDIRTPLKGSGTKADPYRVSCAYDLETVAMYESENTYFVLTDDITFVPADFEFGGSFYNVGNGVVTIGSAEKSFKGNFDGNGHSVNGLSISGNAFGALFGATDGAVISNIVINNACVKGFNYAAVLVGSARNTTISNVVINSADVSAAELGAYAGSVVAYAENTTIENVKISKANISTSAEATDATVEIVGGVAGVFGGTMNNISADEVKAESTAVAGGIIGSAVEAVSVNGADVNVSVSGKIAGGVIGTLADALKLSVSGCAVSGNIAGSDISAGVIGKVTSETNANSLDKSEAPIVSDTIVTAKIEGSGICGAVVGSASAKVFCDKPNMTAVFENVYYSSYNNPVGVFGTEEINSYQNSSYSVFDINNVKYITAESERTYIPLTSQFTVISGDSLKLDGIDDYKSFTVGGKTFNIETITSNVDNAISYDSERSALKLNVSDTDGVKAVLVYGDGLEAAIDVVYASGLIGSGTESDPYCIADADDFTLMLERAGAEGIYYKLTDDIKLSGVASAEIFAGTLNGNGHVLYDYTGESLFGRVTGRITDTGFVGFNILSENTVALGAVAGVVDGGSIENCTVIANVAANGNVQDAGILAGRAVNGASISGVITSGKVIGENALAVGGVVGSINNSNVTNAVSTSYVKGGKNAGGIVGDMQDSSMTSVVFGNMAEAIDGKVGNIAGSANGRGNNVVNAYFDSKTSRVSAATGSGDVNASALSTQELAELELDGFATVGGYPVPEALASVNNGKFAVAVRFAAMKVNYLAGLSAGDVFNYTSVSTETEISGNEIKLDTTSGLVITLVPTADYADAENAIIRYSNPASSNGANVSCTLVDATSGGLGNKLAAVLLKTKLGEQSNSFSFFTKASEEAKTIAPVVITDGGLYVDAVLPDGVTYTVSAVDENGNAFNVVDAKNEGRLVETGTASSVIITITAEDDVADNWGLHPIWGAIGK